MGLNLFRLVSYEIYELGMYVFYFFPEKLKIVL